MRILFTFVGGTGHFLPLVPIARAAAARGHDVIVSGQEAMTAVVEAAGFAMAPSGGRTLADPAIRRALAPLDRAHEERVIGATFAGRVATARAQSLLAIAEALRPDVIVRDEVDFGAAVAAERLGLPHVAVQVLVAGGFLRPELIAEPLDALRAIHGLDPDPELAMLHRHLTLVPAPRSFRAPSDPLPATAQHIRPAAVDPYADSGGDAAGIPSRVRAIGGDGRAVMYLTLGTVFHQESGDLFQRALAGLSALDADVVVTVGREIDPLELGPQPRNVIVERFVPQADLLPRCDLVISHGGSGSVMGALAFGVPLVVLPMGADQPWNADRCTALGVAEALDPIAASSANVRDAALRVLGRPAFRAAARRLALEGGDQPTSEHAVELIGRLAN